MVDFIEVHNLETGEKILINKKKIKYVLPADDYMFICITDNSTSRKSAIWGYYVSETYEQIRAMLMEEKLIF